MTEKIEFRKRRDFGEIISVTFEFIRQNFSQLGMVMLYVGLPLSVLLGVSTALYQSSVAEAQSSGDLSALFTSFISPYYLMTIALTLLLYAGVTGAAYSYILRYLSQADSSTIRVDAVLNDTINSAPMVISTSLLLGLLLFFAAIPSIFLLFIPLIYLGAVLAPLLFMRYYEKIGFFDAFSRCFKLAQSEWWKVFGVVVVLSLVGYFISLAFSIPSVILSIIISFASARGEAPSDIMTIIFAVFSAISSFGTVIQFALASIGIAFVYFDLVERKEASGLLNRIDQISGSSS